jgi:hypothetical protein
MKKNVVWWPAVIFDDHKEKYGGYDYFEYSRKTWKYWCKKNDVLFVEFTEPVEKDLIRYRINWQKAIFVFDELERRGIEYDQIALIDSTAMIKWDCPNFFELTDRKFTAFRDRDNMKWTYDSVQGYKQIFDNFKFDHSKYFNSGFMIFNEDHKHLFNSLKDFYIDNIDTFMNLQDNLVRKGNDQTPVNYWMQLHGVDINLDLPFAFNLTHIHRKEMFNHNWQLNEDPRPFFIKYGYIWRFNGIPKDQRSNIMKQTWDLIKQNYDDSFILNRVENKNNNKSTTSGKFKEDIYRIFSDPKFKNMTMLELGCCTGNTTRIYAECFKKVIAIDLSERNLEIAKENCKDVDNIEFIQADVYSQDFKLPQTDVVHIDAGHTYEQVIYDIDRCIFVMHNPIIIMDDYGHEGRTVRNAIDTKLNEGKLKLYTFVGEDKGYTASNNKVFIGREGMVCNV